MVSSRQALELFLFVLTSRGDTAQTKFNSILLALAYASRSQEDREALGKNQDGLGDKRRVVA